MTKMTLTERSRWPFALTWVVVAVIAVLTLMPAPEAPEEVGLIPHLDKIVHYLMFGGLAAVWWWEYSLRRGYPAAPWRALWPIAVAVSLFGGVIELLQGALTADRSADIFDWLADTLGAFSFPAVCRGIIDRILPADAVRLERATRASEIEPAMRELYHLSFPPEERRQWDEIVRFTADRSHPLNFALVTRRGEAVGFITWWRFRHFRYVEHFAVSQAVRGGGIGAAAIKRFVSSGPDPVVLEVELPTEGEMAQRRIRFYERCGFTSHPEYTYIQPPYAEGLSEVPLMLMTAAAGGAPGTDLRAIDRTLKVMVYKTQPDF